jgi:hypothetical protein
MSLDRSRRASRIAALIGSIVISIYPLKLSSALPSAHPQPEVTIAGTITNRNGEAMNVSTAGGGMVEVVLNADTKIERPDGVVGFRKKRLDITALAPSLSVVVQGLQYENDQLVAKTITFSRSSLQSASTAPFSASRSAKDINLADSA